MDERNLYISVGVVGGCLLGLIVAVSVLAVKNRKLANRVDQMQNTNKIRVQKLKMEPDKNHSFHNPGLTPDEELSRRGFSMYQPHEHELESGRRRAQNDQQASGPMFVEDLARELESRKQNPPPPFLLQAIQENKRKRHLNNPVVAESSQRRAASETNPNFIY